MVAYMPLSTKLAGVSGALAILFGAFGAHGLKGKVDDKMLKAFETGAHYHLIHSVALLSAQQSKRPQLTTLLFTAGTVLFSGSLYAMVLTDNRKIGIVTPIGGITLVLGWLSIIL